MVSERNPRPDVRGRGLRSVPMDDTVETDPNDLLGRVARGDEAAFAAFYDHVSARVYGLVRRLLRDPAQAEEVTQEVLVETWRTASRFDPTKGSAAAWCLTIAHRRAVDRIRSEQASTDRTLRAAVSEVPFDVVAEEATTQIEHLQVRRCLDTLTALQRQAIELAYYQGHTYREVSELLDTALPTVKTRMRDGLIRLRDCVGVQLG